VLAKQERADEIEPVQGLNQQQPHRLPGEDQPAFQPEAKQDQDVSDIAEEQEILCAILLPIHRRPDGDPCRPSDFQPQRNTPAHGSIRALWSNYISNLMVHTSVPNIAA
jgi:hypothetical protein